MWLPTYLLRPCGRRDPTGRLATVDPSRRHFSGDDSVREDNMIDRVTATVTTDLNEAVSHPCEGSAPLRRTLVRDVMTTAIVSVRPDTCFDEIARTLRGNYVRAVPVLDAQGELLGVVSSADLMNITALGDPERPTSQGRWHRGGGAWDRSNVARALMTSPVTAVSPNASVAEAARALHDHKLGWLAVVEPTGRGAQRLVGVLGRSDLLAVFLRDDTELREEIVRGLSTRLALVDPAKVEVQVRHGVVTLAGHLPTLAEARSVTEFVERLEGVVKVIHGLTHEVDRGAAGGTAEDVRVVS
jgi:CBS-domain-containing membrane protein